MKSSNFVNGTHSKIATYGYFFLTSAIIANLSSGRVLAATTVWTGSSSGGVFNDDANWSSLAPGHTNPASDLGIFNNATNVDGTITFNADITNYRTFVQNDAGTISFDVGTHKWTMTGFFLVGASSVSGFPVIKQIGGEIQSEQLLLGTEESGPNPSIELTGSGTHWHTTYDSGGYLIGIPADGATMKVTNGAQMSAYGQALIGLAGSSNSKLIIDGIGSQMNLGNYLGIGHTASDFGTIATGSRAELINGATGTASGVLMGITTGATDNTLLVSGAGSMLTLTGVNNNDGAISSIGREGINNLMQIDDGGIVNGSNRFQLGSSPTSTGNQILINNGSLSGTSLEINQGSVSVTKGTVDLVQYYDDMMMVWSGGGITATNGASSTITFNSGTVRSVNADIDNGSPFTVGDGGADSATYIMRKDVDGNRGVHTFTNGLSLSANGILSGDGDIVGNISGTAGAKVEVGASPGIINVTGDWNNAGIGIDLEVDDLSSSVVPGEQFDQLNISGAFTHGGSVTIDISELVGPASSQQLKLIGWGSQSGLSSSTMVSFVGGSPLTYSFQSDGLYVSVSAGGIPGDYNGDGSVNAADYVIWRKNNGSVSGYNVWRAHFGESGGSGALATVGAAVPEPGSRALAISMVATILFVQRRSTAHINHEIERSA
ncbi:MAG TPA: hypothetical protein VHE81_20940 [Lacipirellulaceae bacterium]|nr:hypothetical protein [Lacipirellulaceae bacterium]